MFEKLKQSILKETDLDLPGQDNLLEYQEAKYCGLWSAGKDFNHLDYLTTNLLWE